MLRRLAKGQIRDGRLREMVDRVNHLTTGGYEAIDANGAVLMPLLERVVARSKEKEEWHLYFYAMAQLLWLSLRERDTRRAFRVSEIFHQDYAHHVGEEVNPSGWHWRIYAASLILSFYVGFWQIDDAKLQHMLGLLLDYEGRYGDSWNYAADGYYMLWMATAGRDKELAEAARGRLLKADYRKWSYIFFYGASMICYYAMHEDFGGIEETISGIIGKTVPLNYQWCYNHKKIANEEWLVNQALESCLKYGSRALFVQIFGRWKKIYQEAPKGELGTFQVLFHELAGEWGQGEDRLRVAEKDDQDARGGREVPLDSLYWALCWRCYFGMLDQRGVKTVNLRLGDGPGNAAGAKWENGEKPDLAADNTQEWQALEAARYFERQADGIGAQMDKARKQFHYARVKQNFEECFLNAGT